VETFDQLCVFTKIDIYGYVHIDVNESPLTAPLLLEPLNPEDWTGVVVNYKVDAEPGIEYQLIRK
jgi:hypothetical protein